MKPNSRHVIIAIVAITLSLGVIAGRSEPTTASEQPVVTAGWNNGFPGFRRFFAFLHRFLRALIEEDDGGRSDGAPSDCDPVDGGGDGGVSDCEPVDGSGDGGASDCEPVDGGGGGEDANNCV